jgi:hypothetical protein
VVISETSHFAEYELAQTHLVPIVRVAWVEESLRSGKLRQMGTFFPQDDARQFMAGVCVSISGDFIDSDALGAGLREFGALVVAPVTVYTTHVVARSRKDDRNVMVVSTFKNNIKVVSPEWVFACFRARRRVDEAPYLLKNPTTVDDQEDEDPAAGHAQQSLLLEGKRVFFGSDLEISAGMQDCLRAMVCLAGGSCADTLDDAGVNIYIGQYRDGEQYLKASRAGTVVVANTLWLFRILCRDRWTSPLNYLFHYPFVRGGLPGMEKTVISISLYSNANRDFVTDLVLRLGGTFTRNLKSDNTHLVTLRPEGIKVQAAKSWNVLIVNHLWLEESYAAWEMKPVTDERYIFGKKVWPVGQTKLDERVLETFYGEAEEEPEGEDGMNVGENKEPEEQAVAVDSEDDITLAGAHPEHESQSIDKFADKAQSASPPPVNIDDDSEDLKKPEDDAKSTENEAPQQPLAKTPSVEGVKTPKRTPAKRTFAEEATPSNPSPSASATPTPRSSHRKAKDKAAAKLHEDISDLNEFQKRRRTRDIPLLPGESKRAKVAPASSHSPPSIAGHHASSPTPEPSTHASSSSSISTVSRSQPSIRVRLLITGIDSTKFSFKHLPKLGIALADDPAEATHVVAPKVCRTANFLIALAHAPILLNEQFLRTITAPAAALSIDPIDAQYLLADPVAERETLAGATLAQVLTRAHHAHAAGGLLRGCTFNLTPKVRGGLDVFAAIVAAHGARAPVTVKAAARVATNCEPCDEELNVASKQGRGSGGALLRRIILIAAADQKQYIAAFRANFSEAKGYKAYCYPVDWLFQVILRMKLEFPEEGAL